MPDNRISVCGVCYQLFRLVAVGPEHRVVNGIDAVNGSKRRDSYDLRRAGTSAISPLDLLAGHPANRTEQGASAHALIIRHSKADEISMNHYRGLDCCLRIVSAQTRSAFVGKSAAQFLIMLHAHDCPGAGSSAVVKAARELAAI